ncbi:MAG TPA: branched-chain amino acid transaminase [Polyangiaceae bacterium]|jgi:branched-chain amino acid aminotransferase|nr:branched-chain amino acid transaminase [Polyangiaceae bacterium]
MLTQPEDNHVVWLDGAFVPWREATMHISDHHFGAGVFEGVRAYASDSGANLFRLAEHTNRLFGSARILNMRIPEQFNRDCLNQAQVDVLKRNGFKNAYLRPFVYYAGFGGLAPSTRGLSVRVAVMALAWSDAGVFGKAQQEGRSLALRTSSFARPPANAVFVKAKANANYLNGILAIEEARSAGADDALLLDQAGFVTETSGANLFLVRGGTLYTPPLTSVLEGITRSTVIALAKEAGIAVLEQQLKREDAYLADEVFLTGTAVEVVPVREVDQRQIGKGSCGPITERLRAAYVSHVRARGAYRAEWLTPV